jgi:hypothetical protein
LAANFDTSVMILPSAPVILDIRGIELFKLNEERRKRETDPPAGTSAAIVIPLPSVVLKVAKNLITLAASVARTTLLPAPCFPMNSQSKETATNPY